ncbi:hypothetical protein GFS31_19040 [Leptolyngbya sp. BL0902]|uniref:hypothetical protein n=1 Tax=Leptolyngbya sp. BL0902 TaxID=1115757 RepID=UPI0018E7C4C4|nr:hypothetical protein [Leptolyngbya sp. BL0902]QQE65218.1 hypothetical protein GFS31_19040 [Leptolyngbya sp. BL0902]
MSCHPHVFNFPTLNTHFITLSLSLADLKADPVTTVETALGQVGEPLRWAITQVDEAAGLATVEAVVTTVEVPSR